MKPGKARKILLISVFSILGVVVVILAGCVRVSNGTWYVWNAPVPEGWPAFTPVGEVEVKAYPVYRAATVADVNMDGAVEPMFMMLFNHIKREDISMTAPVAIGYDDAREAPRRVSMAFLYRNTAIGTPGVDGPVRVEDLEARTFASVGVRGDYSTENYCAGLAILDRWLSENGAWQADGAPRYLGYNGPFVLKFARYGEVQVPVRKRGTQPDSPPNQ